MSRSVFVEPLIPCRGLVHSEARIHHVAVIAAFFEAESLLRGRSQFGIAIPVLDNLRLTRIFWLPSGLGGDSQRQRKCYGGESVHYDLRYFDYQKGIGEFGAWANASKFIDYVSGDQTVLDLGCGGGWLLAGLPAAKRIGVEIGETAATEARKRLDAVYTDAADIPPVSVDTVISNHALEHMHDPLGELCKVFRAVKPGGRIVIVVPAETISYAYAPGDINNHLFTWSPMCLGNLLSAAGFAVDRSEPYIHKWPPHNYLFWARFGRRTFDAVCRLYNLWDRRSYQVRAVGVKP